MSELIGTVLKGGSITIMARVVGHQNTPVPMSAIESATYSIYLLDSLNVDSRTPVDGHTNVTLDPADVIIYPLVTDDARWTKDGTGYNFLHVVDVSTDQAFTIAGRNYLVEYRLVPVEGQDILVRARLNVI